MNADIPQLYDFVNPADPAAVIKEIITLAQDMDLPQTLDTIVPVHADIIALFQGQHPGYRASTTSYHDLEHTMSVALATARLLHGTHQVHPINDPSPFRQAVLAAYFHDTGLIQTRDDTTGTGAKHMVGHEARSIDLMRDFLSVQNKPAQELDDIASLIRCTILDVSPSQIAFRSQSVGMAGRIVGTADLIAQIADRNYLEKLLLLFREFEEAGLPGFETELDLLQQTHAFYEHVAAKRLDGGLGRMHRHMVHHFVKRFDIAHDLYAEAIARNLDHLESLLTTCQDSFDCYLLGLNRLKEQPRRQAPS